MKNILKISFWLLLLYFASTENAMAGDSFSNDSIEVSQQLYKLKSTPTDSSEFVSRLEKLEAILENKLSKGSYDSWKHYTKIHSGLMQFMGEVVNSEPDSSLIYYFLALKDEYDLRNTVLIIVLLNRIGSIYYTNDNNEQALFWFRKALEIDPGNIIVHHSISSVLINMKDFAEAGKHLEKAMVLSESYRDKSIYANSIRKLAELNRVTGEDSAAIGLYEESFNVFKQVPDSVSMAYILLDLGSVYTENGSARIANNFFLRSYEIFSELNHYEGLARLTNVMADFYQEIKNYSDAKKYVQESLTFADSSGQAELIRSSSLTAHRIYKEAGDYESSYKFYRQYEIMNDSLTNLANFKKEIREKLLFEFQKKQVADSLHQLEQKHFRKAKLEEQNALIESQKSRNYFLGGGIGLCALLFVFIFRAYNQDRKANKIITQQKEEAEYQKELLEHKNKEVIDSINYAKRLQDAILPSQTFIRENLPGAMIYYQPRDIVAGDFYWMQKCHDESTGTEKLFIAVADCTGHGVPGAMVSVVCSNALTRTVKEFKITETGKILDKVSELVEETFSRSQSDVRDGMDISLLCIDRSKQTFQWSGANNSLFIVKKETGLEEIKADKQPIGKYENRVPFTTNKFKIEREDQLFLFTDGYADQFGGEKGKKFNYKNLKSVLTEISFRSAEDQKQFLEDKFLIWKGSIGQIDDVCIVGLCL